MTTLEALLIEDDPVMIEIYRRAVTSAGYEVTIRTDGEQALAYLAEQCPFLVILDLHLPLRSGEEIIQYIRHAEHLKMSKVIIASADAALANWLDQDVDFVLNKPVTFSQIRSLATHLHPDQA